jgi:hypothetical protein
VKRPYTEDVHSSTSSAEGNNMWNYTSVPPYAIMLWSSTGRTLLLLLITREFEICELVRWSREWCHFVHGPLCFDPVIDRVV